MSPLEKAINIIASGSQRKFAAIVSEKSGSELSQQNVNYWVRNKRPCSPKYAATISELTGGKVTAHQLRPDVFPKEDKAA